MKYTYYIVQDRSLDKDKVTESVIAKYHGTRFLAAVPLPRFAKIDDSLFNKAPRIPKKNVEYVLTKQDLNKDGIKDVVISIFNKGKLLVCLPFNRHGGEIVPENQKKKPDDNNTVKNQIEDDDSFEYNLGATAANSIIYDGLLNAFNPLEN